MPNIKIDRVEIHLTGISPRLARSTIAGLGNELLEQLIKERFLLKEKSLGKISGIDAGTLRSDGDGSPSDLRKLIAVTIAASIALKTKTEAGKEG